MSTYITAVVACCLFVAGCATTRSPESHLTRIHDERLPSHIVDRESMDALSRVYRQHFIEPLRNLDALTDEDIEAGFQAAYKAAFYAHYYDPASHESFLLDAGRYFDELTRRGKATDRYGLFVHHLYLTARMFDEAEAVRLRHPGAGIQPVPTITTDPSFDPAKPGVYTLDADGGSFHLHNVHIGLDRTILIVAGCPISRNAARDIQADPILRQAFADGNAVWLGSADTLDLEQVRQWNAELPHSPLQVIHDEQQWPDDVDFTTHPNFHFFVDGKLVARHSGWSPDGVPEPVTAGLTAMGVL